MKDLEESGSGVSRQVSRKRASKFAVFTEMVMGNGKLDKISQRDTDSFLSTFLQILAVAQWFGIPVSGNKLSVCWSVILLLMLSVTECMAIWKLIKVLEHVASHDTEDSITARLSGSIFYGNGLLSLIISWRFVTSWRKVEFYWTKAEATDRIFLYPDQGIQKRLICVTCGVTVFASGEHLLSMVSAIGLDSPPMDFMKRYVLRSHDFLLPEDQYSLWAALPIFFLGKIATILWNFQDLIIILISMGLASRYHRLNLYVKRVVKCERRNKAFEKVGPIKYSYTQNQTWRRIREAYVRQAALVRMVNAQIGPLVLLSTINNFYFICLQLFLGINKGQGSFINLVYYFISLGWLVLRACSVVMAAAEVHVQSKRGLAAINNCPSGRFNVEIRRLNNQLINDYVALSGMGLFRLDRHTLLEVAGNIIKYELVLIEYDK